MNLLRIVLDTNALLRCISGKSSYAIVLNKLFENSYELCFSTEILLEYEEKITQIFSHQTSELITGAFSLLDNVRRTEIYFRLNLISADSDDNKFCDCAFATNAHFIVTNDKHFNILKTIKFPSL